MTQLVVVCDCNEFVDALHEKKALSFGDFLDRKRWASGVRVCGHRNGRTVFAKAETRTGVHQVAIQSGEEVCWVCKHGLAALTLLGGKVRVIWESDQAEKVAKSMESSGVPVRVFDVNGCLKAICW